MPFVHKLDHFDPWMPPNIPAQAVQKIIADSLDEFSNYPVSTKVNKTLNDFTELLVPLKD
jgi:putative SOS response-associated peptidase YedK